MVMKMEGLMKDVFSRNQSLGRGRSLRDQFVFYLENVGVKFNNLQALKEITLTVNPG